MLTWRNWVSKVSPYPDVSLWGMGRDLRISEGNTEPGQASFHNLINPRDMSSNAFPGTYVK